MKHDPLDDECAGISPKTQNQSPDDKSKFKLENNSFRNQALLSNEEKKHVSIDATPRRSQVVERMKIKECDKKRRFT